jgi:hypothetical protein
MVRLCSATWREKSFLLCPATERGVMGMEERARDPRRGVEVTLLRGLAEEVPFVARYFGESSRRRRNWELSILIIVGC